MIMVAPFRKQSLWFAKKASSWHYYFAPFLPLRNTPHSADTTDISGKPNGLSRLILPIARGNKSLSTRLLGHYSISPVSIFYITIE